MLLSLFSPFYFDAAPNGILRIFFLLHCLLLCGLGILATMGLGDSSSAEGLVPGSPGSSPAGAMQPAVLWRHCLTDCERPFGVAETS